MITNLLYPDKPYREHELSVNDNDVIMDLELNDIIKIASKSNYYLKNVFTHVLMDKVLSIDVVNYRQEILKDFDNNRERFDDLYKFMNELNADLHSHHSFGVIETSPTYIVQTSTELIKFMLAGISSIVVLLKSFDSIKSRGLNNILEDMKTTFSPENVKRAVSLAEAIEPDSGYKAQVSLDDTFSESSFKLQRSDFITKDGKKRYKKAEKITFQVVTESIVNELNHKTDLMLEHISPSMGRLANDLVDYFKVLLYEVSFYKCALNLIDYLKTNNLDFTYPEIDNEKMEYENLYDLALAIKSRKKPEGNVLSSSEKKITVITGANQGGKTTFLRSFGQSVLLSRAGLVVPAKSIKMPLYSNVFVHFDREEDTKMESGKFDDELKRISGLVDSIEKNSVVLFNEPFQSTNEHEGSVIGFNIIKALSDSGIRIMLVTHMYELSMLVNDYFKTDAIFLKAERDDMGNRSYHLVEGMPLKTSFAMDLYNKTIN